MTNETVIQNFYEAFAKGDAEAMVNCYHKDITFQDPAFGILHGDDARNMWRMLIQRSKGAIQISFKNIKANDKMGSAEWQATYFFSQTGRTVVNKITASFELENGKIIRHTDYFDIWKWAQQALGWKGYLLGWSSFMKNKIRKQSLSLLKNFNQK